MKNENTLYVSFVTETGKVLSVSNFLPGNIININGKNIKVDSQIRRMLVIRDTILVLHDHPEMYDSRSLSYSLPYKKKNGNIFAMDMEGNILWHIEDIIGEFRSIFDIMFIPSDEEKKQGTEIMIPIKNHIIKSHDYIICANLLSEYYWIDITDRKLIKREMLKW